MSIYSYHQSSVIDEITFRKNAKGGLRAYLHAGAGADAMAVESVKQTLKDAGYQWISFELDGKPTLEVRGFKHESQLLAALNQKELLRGDPNIQKEKADHVSWRDWLSKWTLRGSGGFYLFGDWNFFKYGHKEEHLEDMLAGIMYFLGTNSLVWYGRNDQSDIQVHDLSKQIVQHLIKKSVVLSKESNPEYFTHEEKGTYWQDR